MTTWTRTLGLQRASSSTVATLLYTEIGWCFAADVLVLAMQPDSLQLAGAALIAGGAAVFALAPPPVDGGYVVTSASDAPMCPTTGEGGEEMQADACAKDLMFL